MVIVVDALDECIKDDDVRQLIALFATVNSIQNISLKLFLTSRPETEISLGFRHISNYHDFILQNIEETIVAHDINILFDYQFGLIRKDNTYIDSHWPKPREVQTLVKKAGKSFIYAATTCRYVREDDSEARL